MGFNHGTKHLSGQTQAIIREREENDKRLKEEAKKKQEEKKKQEKSE